MNRLNKLAVFLVLFLFVDLLSAKEWRLDKAHSKITFEVQHMVITTVEGKFDQFDVSFVSEKDDFTDAKIKVTIPVKSINTDNKTRDDHLRSADFFDAENFPTITFVSKKVEKVVENKYKITGDLTIRGTTKTIVLDATFGGLVKDPWGNTRIGWEATGTINRFDFGLKWDKTLETGNLVVGKVVKIIIRAEFLAK